MLRVGVGIVIAFNIRSEDVPDNDIQLERRGDTTDTTLVEIPKPVKLLANYRQVL